MSKYNSGIKKDSGRKWQKSKPASGRIKKWFPKMKMSEHEGFRKWKCQKMTAQENGTETVRKLPQIQAYSYSEFF